MPGEQGRSWDQVAASTQSKVGALQQALGGSPLLSQALVMEDSLSMVQQLADFGATMEQWTLERSEEVPPEDYRRYRGRLVGVSFRMTVAATCRHNDEGPARQCVGLRGHLVGAASGELKGVPTWPPHRLAGARGQYPRQPVAGGH